jgi:two-component system cell cycle response regulator CtrA
MRVLLIEDDSATAQSIELMLKSEGFNVYTTDLGEEGIDLGKVYDYDIILLDLNLPDMSGFEVLRSLRVSKVKTSILILSGLPHIEDKVRGLGFGADDYMTKPFHRNELVARIHAIVRRSKGHAQSVIQTGDLVVSLDTKTVEVNGARVHLTRKEYQMLELLSLRKGTTLTKEMFLNHLYGGMDEPELKIIDVFTCKLRKKLANASNGKNYIETVWGRGYVLCEPVETQEKSRRERQALRSTGGRRYSENPQYGFKTFPHWYLRQRFLTVTSTNNAPINKQYVMRLLVRGRRSYFFETIANAVKRLTISNSTSFALNFMRSRLMWLSMVRSSTYSLSS